MINLLPIDDKREILAGRTNRILLRYMVSLLVILGVIMIVFVFAYILLFAQKANSEQRIATNEAKVAERADDVAAIDEFTQNLATIKQILAKRAEYSAAVVRIAQATPGGVIIDTVALSPASLTEPQTLSFRAKSESRALALKDSFNASSDYFTDAHFTSVARGEGGEGIEAAYPYTVELTVTFKKELFDE